MRRTILILLAVFITKFVTAQQYDIKANITGFANGTRFYLNDVDVNSNIDSAIIQGNHFELKGTVANAPKVLWLTTTSGKEFYYTVLLISNEKVNIKGDIKDFPFYLSITGSKSQDDFNALFSLLRDGYKQRDELVRASFALKGDSAGTKRKAIWKAIGKIDSTDDKINMDFIGTHHNSYAGLMQLFYVKGSFSKDSLQQIYIHLKPEFKNSSYGQRIATYLKIGDILKEGDSYADFEAMDRNGKKHRLSDIKGKYVLLDFSATYCGPCVNSVTDLKNISKNYPDKVEIITYSADGGKGTWIEGVKRDHPTWLSLWDGKGVYGETMLKYGINGYPTFVLIDPKGKIISKMVGYDKPKSGKGNIEAKIDEVIANNK